MNNQGFKQDFNGDNSQIKIKSESIEEYKNQLESGGDVSIKNKLGNPNIQNFLQIYGNMSQPQYLRGLNNQVNDGFEKDVEIQ